MEPKTPDNRASQSAAMESGPTLLMATRAGRLEHTPEAEPVLVAQTSAEIILVLDDGDELRFDRSELRRALDA
jgi:hypothetical protein